MILLPEGDHSIADWPSNHKRCGGVQGDFGDIGDAVREPDIRQWDLEHGEMKSTESQLLLCLICFLECHA